MMRDWGTKADNRNSRPTKLTIWQNECMKCPDTHTLYRISVYGELFFFLPMCFLRRSSGFETGIGKLHAT